MYMGIFHVQGLLIFYNYKKLDPVGQHFYYKKLSKANYIDALKGIKKLSHKGQHFYYKPLRVYNKKLKKKIY